MNRSIGILLVAALGVMFSTDTTYGQSSSRRSAMTPSSVTQQAQEMSLLPTAGPSEDSETASDEFQQVDPEISTLASQAVAMPTPRNVLDLSTSLRTPTPTKINLPAPARPGFARVSKPITLASDRFAHRELLFEEPIHERHGITGRPFYQLTKSTVVFFGRSLFLPGTLIIKKHLSCDSGEGWRESQGDRICPSE